MEKILRKEKVRIYCKHCKREVENVWVCKMNSIIGTRYALLCAECQKWIGIYSAKDFSEILEAHNVIFNEFQISLN